MSTGIRNNLISSATLVQVPQVIVKIGDYEFGSYTQINGHAKFPNYIQSLHVTKINGQVNNYTLQLDYLITEFNDPNYFEKVFSSVSTTRKIYFTYGDCSQKNFMYKNEEAMIVSISSSFSPDGAKISYTIKAISAASLAASGTYPFPARFEKPSTVIYEILANNELYGLQDIFYGMRDIGKCQDLHLIADNDVAVQLEAYSNASVLDYLQYLVDSMNSRSKDADVAKTSFYVIKYLDDVSDTLGGPYFQVVEVDANIQHPEAYEIDYGYPGNNLVRDLQVDNGTNYSIYYEYQTALHPQEYVSRINAAGEYEKVYAPILSSNNDLHRTTEADKAWWSKVSQYPIKASITIKGLLRPALLMSYLRLNILFFGRKHIYSGLYIITKQEDTINSSGYSTKLDLVRIGEDESGDF